MGKLPPSGALKTCRKTTRRKSMVELFFSKVKKIITTRRFEVIFVTVFQAAVVYNTEVY